MILLKGGFYTSTPCCGFRCASREPQTPAAAGREGEQWFGWGGGGGGGGKEAQLFCRPEHFTFSRPMFMLSVFVCVCVCVCVSVFLVEH